MSQSVESGAHLGGLERWGGGGCGRRPWSPGPWLRRRRVDSHPLGTLWRLWPEAVIWPRAKLAQPRHLGCTVTQWPYHAHCRRRCPTPWESWPVRTPRDPTSIDSSAEDYLAAVAHPLEALHGLRVAWSVDFGYAPVDPEVRRVTAAAAERFQAFGCEVEAVNPDWDNPREPASAMWYVSYAARLGERYDQRPEWFEPSLAEMIEAGRRISGVQHAQAQLARTVFYEQVRHFFERYDLLVTPQMPLGAWSVERGPSTIEGKPTPSMFDRLNFTFPFNQTGQPAASVPCGFTSEGLPVALQIVGRWHADRLVLQAAAACEQAAPWAQMRPPV